MFDLALTAAAREWVPKGAERSWDEPEVGSLIGAAHQVWRVLRVVPCPPELYTEELASYVRDCLGGPAPILVRLRPAIMDSGDPVLAATKDVSVGAIPKRTSWFVFPDGHYPVCGSCREPLPCREVYNSYVARHEIEAIKPFELAGVCPACKEPVTDRQKAITFDENLVIPGGPPLTFHLRQGCFWQARDYENRWVAGDPEQRRITLTCTGLLTNHGDGTFECTEMGECRGAAAYHPDNRRCECAQCHTCPRSEWNWKPTRRREHCAGDA